MPQVPYGCHGAARLMPSLARAGTRQSCHGLPQVGQGAGGVGGDAARAAPISHPEAPVSNAFSAALYGNISRKPKRGFYPQSCALRMKCKRFQPSG